MSAFRVILIQFLDVLYRIIVYLCFARQDAVRHSQISEQVHICLCAHLLLSLSAEALKTGGVCQGQFQYWNSDFA